MFGIDNQQILAVENWKYQINSCIKRIKEIDDQIPRATEPFRTQLENERRMNRDNYSNFSIMLAPYEAVNLQIGDLQTLPSRYHDGDYIIAYFEANRLNSPNIPSGIQKIQIQDRYGIADKTNPIFVQFIVNLKAERSFAKDDNDIATVKKIDEWFRKFENLLKKIFENEELRLRFDRKRYNFDLLLPGYEPFDLNTLSDGYSAVINIITELMIRMEKKSSMAYEIPGIVLIDEIETHLHVKLQKLVLPILTTFFPNIQFIVSTHSPFVITSLEDAVVYDLENNIQIDDLSKYSYSAIIEGYLQQDQYSDVLKEKLENYYRLKNKIEKTEDDRKEILIKKDEILALSKYHAPHIEAEVQKILLEDI